MAVPIKDKPDVLAWPYPWDTGAPLPLVLTSERTAILIYSLPINTEAEAPEATRHRWAMVTFNNCTAHCFELIGDEVQHGLPWWDDNCTHYTAIEIKNSSWLKRIKDVHRVHNHFSEQRWVGDRHIVLLFHDSMFECISEGYTVEPYPDPLENVLNEARRRLTGVEK